jgi:hypothetical protein
MPPSPVSRPALPLARASRRRLLLAALAAAIAALAPRQLRADTIAINNAEVRVEDDSVLLNAEFEVTLNPTLEEALQRGIPLYFLLEVEIVRPRWYWFDEKTAQSSTQYRISFLPLTRQYRVASGLLTQTFDSLEEVERFLGRVSAREIARVDQFGRSSPRRACRRSRCSCSRLRARIPSCSRAATTTCSC